MKRILQVQFKKKRAFTLTAAVILSLAIVAAGCKYSRPAVNDAGDEAASAMQLQSHGHAHEDMPGMDMSDMDMSGMEMDASSGAVDGASWAWPSGQPQAGTPSKLRITLTDAKGKPDAGLQISHEKKLHLIIVSRGLSTFMHLHPVETAHRGVFELPVTFAAAGSYKLIADFKPKGGEQQWQSKWVQVGGSKGAVKPPQTEPMLVVDKKLVQVSEGMKISLSFESEPRSGEAATLQFSFADSGSGEPVSDLQPYLGSVGHVVIMDAEARQYLHVHAMGEAEHGPIAQFRAVFPKPGLYKIWGQFQRNNRVATVPFVIQVTERQK
ncbi:hypothetical protein [Paenibacillus sp. R14(2021)]|uniref:hypothetical protein n=1 Tax=Paenibacillus sp. R14(2021) TaxID=2859228 RepID=UPI001C6153F9|nr:hypothetical protein [Paenibacillus sp. R14(2021)]